MGSGEIDKKQAASFAASVNAERENVGPVWNQLNGASLPLGAVALAGGFLTNHSGLVVGGLAVSAGGYASKEMNKRGNKAMAKVASAAGYAFLVGGLLKVWR